MFRIRKLDIFIIKQFGTLFVGTFIVSLFVLMMQFLWQYVDELIGKGLSLDVLGEFFWYMSLMMVPEALPLAVLLSSLITFGNLGESSELTAIKAAGISLIKAFRRVIIFTFFIALVSFFFQDTIGPNAKKHFNQLLNSMKQKNPELEIPEGVFYDGIPDTNLYVEKRDLKTGRLYNIMIYRMTDSYEDQAIILADSGLLQSTAEKKHLVLNLWNGEWFENMRSQEFGSSASVPYRRESFVHKKLVIDFSDEFNRIDMSRISDDARTKSIAKIRHDKDSLVQVFDSVGNAYYQDARQVLYPVLQLKKSDLVKAKTLASTKNFDLDTLYNKMTPEERRQTIERALINSQQTVSDLDFKSMITSDGDKMIRMHDIAEINKYLLSLTCLIFFFIGAPLGAIIRKGGLGVPIIISVFVFIIYYILNNTGYRMSRQGDWAVWFGRGLSPAILIPTAIFITYKANKDSAVFNIDMYRNLAMRILGLRIKRSISSKEVIINAPKYAVDATMLKEMNADIVAYVQKSNLKSPPNFIRTFFKYQPDHEIEQLSNNLETIIDDLSNTRNKLILSELNKYPVLITKAHTRPFEYKWLNIAAAIILPVGLFLYFRMWGFRLRLYRDLKIIKQTNDNIIEESEKIIAKQKQ
jgi:permease, yjgP/yjgQ family